MDWKKVLAYVGFAAALIAFLLMSLGILPDTWAIMIMSIGGFGAGAGALRAFIESKGLKTYILIGSSVLLGILAVFKVISTDIVLKAYAIITGLLGVTIQQAASKAKG